MSSTITDHTYHELMKIVGAEIGGESHDTLTPAELDECRESAKSAALDEFPNIEAADLFPALDEIAAAEYGIHW